MKKIKKIIITAGTLATSASPVAFVVACGGSPKQTSSENPKPSGGGKEKHPKERTREDKIADINYFIEYIVSNSNYPKIKSTPSKFLGVTKDNILKVLFGLKDSDESENNKDTTIKSISFSEVNDDYGSETVTITFTNDGVDLEHEWELTNFMNSSSFKLYQDSRIFEQFVTWVNSKKEKTMAETGHPVKTIGVYTDWSDQYPDYATNGGEDIEMIIHIQNIYLIRNSPLLMELR